MISGTKTIAVQPDGETIMVVSTLSKLLDLRAANSPSDNELDVRGMMAHGI